MNKKTAQLDRQWPKQRELCGELANNECRAHATPNCTGRFEHAHHIILKGRGVRIDEQWNLLATCQPCHEHIHRYPEEATANGWMAPAPPVTPLFIELEDQT